MTWQAYSVGRGPTCRFEDSGFKLDLIRQTDSSAGKWSGAAQLGQLHRSSKLGLSRDDVTALMDQDLTKACPESGELKLSAVRPGIKWTPGIKKGARPASSTARGTTCTRGRIRAPGAPRKCPPFPHIPSVLVPPPTPSPATPPSAPSMARRDPQSARHVRAPSPNPSLATPPPFRLADVPPPAGWPARCASIACTRPEGSAGRITACWSTPPPGPRALRRRLHVGPPALADESARPALHASVPPSPISIPRSPRVGAGLALQLAPSVERLAALAAAHLVGGRAGWCRR